MPVLVVPGGTPIAARLVDALRETGGQVRAYVTDPADAPPLRARGVHVAIGGPIDVERLEAACAQVHTVVHLTGDAAGRRPRDESEALEVTGIAAHAADVVRVIVVRPVAGRAARGVDEGMHWLADRCFEVVVVDDTGDEAATRAAILRADARES